MATKTIAADGSGDFTTLAAWRDSLPETLTEPEICQIKGTITETISFAKATSAANYVEFRAFPGQEHNGTLGSGARWIGGGNGRCLESGGRHFRFVNLELVSNGTDAPTAFSGAVSGATLLVSNCIMRAPSMTGTGTMCLWSATTMSVVLENSIFISGARCMDSRNVGSMTVRNCTWWSLTDQLVVIAGPTTDIKNCYAGRVGGTQQVWSSAATPTGSHNASSDTTATARFPTGSINSVAGTAAFENPTTGDFRLKTGSVLIDAGVTISGFTTDIIGTTRPQGAGYDIGAFEYGSGASSTPIAFSGSVSNQTGPEGAAIALDLSTYFSGSETPFAYSVQSGTLPAGLSLNTSTGVISGTPTTAGVSSGIVVRATDATPDTADTNSFSITINATNTSPSFTGPSIAAISATEGVALSSLDVSTRFSDAESALTFSAVGSWPAGVTVSSAGVISGTPTTTGTYSGLQVRATDAGALTADSNAFSITVAAAALPSTITVTEPLKNNTGTVLASQSGVRVAVLKAADLVSVYETSGLTTNATGMLAPITDASIITGQQYHVAIKLADGGVGITGPITAS